GNNLFHYPPNDSELLTSPLLKVTYSSVRSLAYKTNSFFPSWRSICTSNSGAAVIAVSFLNRTLVGLPRRNPSGTALLPGRLYPISVRPWSTPAPEYPTAHKIRPQFGSPPHQLVRTSELLATARAAISASRPVLAFRTRTVTNRDTPSPSRTIIFASSR